MKYDEAEPGFEVYRASRCAQRCAVYCAEHHTAKTLEKIHEASYLGFSENALEYANDAFLELAYRLGYDVPKLKGAADE